MGQSFSVGADEAEIYKAFFAANRDAGFITGGGKSYNVYVSRGGYSAFKQAYNISPIDVSPPSQSQHLVDIGKVLDEDSGEMINYQNRTGMPKLGTVDEQMAGTEDRLLRGWARKHAEVGNVFDAAGRNVTGSQGLGLAAAVVVGILLLSRSK